MAHIAERLRFGAVVEGGGPSPISRSARDQVHHFFEPAMRLALARGRVGLARPEDVPADAVILDEGTVITRGRGTAGKFDHGPTAHAEIVAIRQAARAPATGG